MSSDKQQEIAAVQRQFEADAKQVASVSESTLLKILAHNKDTEYGQKYGFSNITSLKEFKEIHPITKYEHYAQLIDRMLAGEENILTASSIIFFAKSSGTTSMGSQKMIPATNYHCPFRWPLLMEAVVHRAFPTIADGDIRILIVNANGREYKTSSGVRVGSATTSQLPRLLQLTPFPFTSPREVFTLTDVRSATYLHALYALKHPNPLYIHTPFVTTLLDFFRCIERHWQELVADIRQGTIAFEKLLLTGEVKESLRQQLKGDRQRAEELQQIFENGFEGMASRIWPNLQYARCVAGGTFSIYVDKCKTYLGPVPIYSAGHGASEGLFGINLWPGEHIARFVPIPQERYTEYIPVAETNSANPTTLELTELKVGESYEIVLTKFGGLYRYRLGDIIKVVDRYYQLPIYELEGRSGTLLDINGERTTEEMARWSIQEAVREKSCTLVDYTTAIDMDCSPPRYLFFVELAESSGLSQTGSLELEGELSQALDRYLKRVNYTYSEDRVNDDTIDFPRVLLVRKDTFQAATAMLVARGASPLSVKIPRYARRSELIALLRENCFSYCD